MSYENKWKNYKRIVEHLQGNEFQMKMKKLRRKNGDIYTKGGNVKQFGRSNLRFESEGLSLDEADEEVLASFKTQETLNTDVFTNEVMNEDIKKRLAEIADDFVAGIDFDLQIDDITLTGSLANYNWSKYSDFDLHLLVDFSAIDSDQDMVKQYFQDLKALWNIKHNIFLKGFEVEVYIQNTNEDHISTGVYSINTDEWLTRPVKESHEIDTQNIEKKADDFSFQIDRASTLLADNKLSDALDAIDRLRQKVRNMRSIGLAKEDGAYSVENLAFKTLRRSKELDRLATLKNKAYDRQMSIKQ
jgi:hypothetical protein